MIASKTLGMFNSGTAGTVERTQDYRIGYSAGYDAGQRSAGVSNSKYFQRGMRIGKQREVARRNRQVERAIKSMQRILKPAGWAK